MRGKDDFKKSGDMSKEKGKVGQGQTGDKGSTNIDKTKEKTKKN